MNSIKNGPSCKAPSLDFTDQQNLKKNLRYEGKKVCDLAWNGPYINLCYFIQDRNKNKNSKCSVQKSSSLQKYKDCNVMSFRYQELRYDWSQIVYIYMGLAVPSGTFFPLHILYFFEFCWLLKSKPEYEKSKKKIWKSEFPKVAFPQSLRGCILKYCLCRIAT